MTTDSRTGSQRVATNGSESLHVVMLLLKFPPHFAGGGLQASRLMERLGRRGVRVTTLTCSPENYEAPGREAAHGGRVRRFPMPVPTRFRNHLLGIRAFLWLLTHPKWDVLHIHNYSYFAVLPIILARFLGRPILIKTTLLGEEGALSTKSSGIAARLLDAYRSADAIVALSAAIRNDLVTRRKVSSLVLELPNGVDTDLFHPAIDDERARTRESLGIPDHARLVVTCGEINPRKNIISIVRALARMPSAAVVFVAIGPMGDDEAYLTRLRKEIAALPANKEVRLVGSQTPQELATTVRAADVFALMSRAEGLPNSLLEAMASSVACIASDIPGAADVLADGGGLLVHLDDEGALKDTLASLFENEALRAGLALDGLRLIQSKYSLDTIAKRYHDLYRQLLTAKGR